MLKFFRRLRQSLLSENKFSKYLLYAIGEILLVVIGILIALQINNWNELRILNQLKNVYLTRLIQDIEQDTVKINYVVSEIAKNQKTINDFITLINSESNDNLLDSTITNYFTRGWIISEFIPTTNTYKDLSQTGNMKIIKNGELSNKIIEYYGLFDEIHQSNNVNKNWIIPLDLEVAKNTTAFELDPSTSDLFTHKNRIDAINNIKSNAELMERNAAGHYWINESLSNNLTIMKDVSRNLLNALITERNSLEK